MNVMNLVDYKTRERGTGVEMPDERGTSSSCSVCGHEDGDSRVERGLWRMTHKPYYPNARDSPAFTRGRRSKRNDLIDAHVAKSRVEIRETSDSHSIDGLVGFIQCSSTLGFPNFFGEAALECALITKHQ